MTKKITLFFSVCLFITAHSQFNTYSFSQSIGAYNAVGGGTVYGNTANDDQVFVDPTTTGGAGVGTSGAGLPIGFNFTVNGTIYDRIGINCNGFIMLGQSTTTPAVITQISNAYTPISATTTALPSYQFKVSALGMDIEGQAGSELRKVTIGSTPNRTMVVQWVNYRKYNNAGDNYNFQIRLHETSNVIEVIYGSFINNATAATAQVGLRGNNPSDFNNRFVNAINTWSVSVAGTSNTVVVNYNSALVPPNGLIYRWTPPPICNGTPPSNTVQANFTNICPGGSSTLSLLNTYSLSNLVYNWQASTTSSLGPYTPLAGANFNTYFASNIATSTWFQCVVSCLNGGTITSTVPKQVSTAAPVISNPPYSENFESLLINNQLPNCSWFASSPTVICQTYTSASSNNRIPNSGSSFASFKSGTNPTGDFFYTNGLLLNAGVTYSAGVWYITDGNAGWHEFSIMRTSGQNPINPILIASAPTPSFGFINNTQYQPLGATFTVPATGVYYLAIKCRGTAAPFFLSFDDISLTIPCNSNLNPVNLSLNSSADTVCLGQTLTLTASGANTYSWSGGINPPTGPVYTLVPGTSGVYGVTGSNTLTSCSASLSKTVAVVPTAYVSIFSSASQVCAGKQATLTALGIGTFTWSNGSNNSYISVSPTVSTIYSIISSNNFGCSASATTQIQVLSLPVLSLQAIPPAICAGESSTLYALGANSYTWSSGAGLFIGSNISASPPLTTQYTLTGMAANGCENTQTLMLTVDPCLGLEKNDSENKSVKVYPVPCSDEINIDISRLDAPPYIVISDISGKEIMKVKGGENKILSVNIQQLEPGIYFIIASGKIAGKFVKI